MWCVPEIYREFVVRMEDVLRLHARPYRASEPVVCLDERPASLVSRECLGNRRIGHLHTLRSQVAAWRARADKAGRPIRWTFTVKDARRVFRYDGIVTRRSKH